jgi:RNA polymerase sigma-70 factor, ECF subfamily
MEGERFRVLSKLRPWLLKRAQRLSYGRSDAEDLVQEVMRKYVETFPEGEQPSEQGSMGWMATALNNVFISDLRKRAVHQRAEPDPALQESLNPERAESPEQPLSMTVSDAELEVAMSCLSQKQRDVFEASARGLRYAEIAEALGIREGAVAKRIFDARRRLRAKLLEIKNAQPKPAPVDRKD